MPCLPALHHLHTRLHQVHQSNPCSSMSGPAQPEPHALLFPAPPRPTPPCPGERRKVESFDAEAAGTAELESVEERDKRKADPFAQLEQGGEDKRRAMATYTQIAALQEESQAKHRWVGWAAPGG